MSDSEFNQLIKCYSRKRKKQWDFIVVVSPISKLSDFLAWVLANSPTEKKIKSVDLSIDIKLSCAHIFKHGTSNFGLLYCRKYRFDIIVKYCFQSGERLTNERRRRRRSRQREEK